LAWLATQLVALGVAASVVRIGGGAAEVLRMVDSRGLPIFVACVPAPQYGSWAWVWPHGCALVTDPAAVSLIAAVMGQVEGGTEIRRHEARFPGRVDQVGAARREVRGCLGLEHPCLDEAELLTSESATNAVSHTASGRPGGHFALMVEWTADWSRITVTDQGAATVPSRVAAKGGATSGRGVDLIEQLADGWGFSRERAGTRLWFELAEVKPPAGGNGTRDR
jgi:anti-sigma regulatory factor (Ser/Thr protein kinase)